MSRKAVPANTQTAVLVRSRRRCCICFGLNRDTSLKVGQIAHLDHNNTNNAEDNLAFLCFDHHDEYDSKTSQRKGLTEGEVKTFREELQAAVGKAFSVEVHFGEITLPTADPYAGQYVRIGGGEVASAEITLTPLGDGMEGYPRYAVTGSALWGMNRQFGPNLGDMAFIGNLVGNVIEYSSDNWSGGAPHTVKLTFSEGRLLVDEESELGLYGMGVTFRG